MTDYAGKTHDPKEAPKPVGAAVILDGGIECRWWSDGNMISEQSAHGRWNAIEYSPKAALQLYNALALHFAKERKK